MFGNSVLGVSPGKLIAAVAMISTFGALNGWILIQGRIPLAAAEDGLFPRQFAQVSGTRKTPIVGLVASSVLLTGLMAMNYQSSLTDTFTKVIILATLTTLVPYAFAAAAQLMQMFNDRENFTGRRVARDATIAILAFAYSFWMIYGAGQEYTPRASCCSWPASLSTCSMRWRQSKASPFDALPETPEPPLRRLEEERPLAPLGR